MNIFIAHSSDFPFQQELYTPIRESSISTVHTFILPHESGAIECSRSLIENIGLFVADVSMPSTGMGIEIGWADAFGRPILCVCKKGCRPSSSVSLLVSQIHEYDSPEELLSHIEKSLATIAS